MYKSTALFLAILFAASACAASGKNRPAAKQAGSVDQPQLLLAHARDLQAKKGCKAAIPAYRVISSFGEGYDIAQYELGACLLTIDPSTEIEAALFAEEASFWLLRAAWAGNARAQLKLATAFSGAPAAGEAVLKAAPVDAMKWALVYDQNSARALFNMKPVSPPVMDHLNASLNAEMLSVAQAFADSFTPVKMAAFSAPRRQNTGNEFQQRQRPDSRQRRRR